MTAISKNYMRLKPQPDLHFDRVPRCLNENDPIFPGRHNLGFKGWYSLYPDSSHPIAIFECSCGRINYESKGEPHA